MPYGGSHSTRGKLVKSGHGRILERGRCELACSCSWWARGCQDLSIEPLHPPFALLVAEIWAVHGFFTSFLLALDRARAGSGAVEAVFCARKLRITHIKFVVFEDVPGAIHGAIDVCRHPHDGGDMGTIWEKLVINLVYVCTKKRPMAEYRVQFWRHCPINFPTSK